MVELMFGIGLLLWLIFTLGLAVKVKKLASIRKVKRIVVVWFNLSNLPVACCLNIKSAKEYVREVLKDEFMVKENDFEFEWVDLRYPSEN